MIERSRKNAGIRKQYAESKYNLNADLDDIWSEEPRSQKFKSFANLSLKGNFDTGISVKIVQRVCFVCWTLELFAFASSS